jgi:8-oxo-dGTP diphosphatase
MSKPSVSKVKRLYPNQPTVGVGAIIVRNGKILLEKRKNSPGKNKWSIPGGLVDLGENLEKAVIREVKEETCLEAAEASLINVVDDIEMDDESKVKYHFVIIDYHVKVRNGVPKAASDAGELRWVPFGEVEAYNLTSSFRLFFHENRERIEKLNSYS